MRTDSDQKIIARIVPLGPQAREQRQNHEHESGERASSREIPNGNVVIASERVIKRLGRSACPVTSDNPPFSPGAA